MDVKRLNELLDGALAAAAAASEVLLHHLNDQNESLVIRAKRDGSLVSAVDIESHHTIRAVLDEYGIPIISEEGELPAFAERASWPLFWLVDPLDGTQSYLDNREGFAVNIALCDASGPLLGVVADPLANRVYAGASSAPPFVAPLNDLNQRSPIVSKPPQPPYRLVTSWNEALELEALLPAGFNPREFRMEAVSGALKFCLLATGEADVHARSASYMEWDCAAGDGILRSMGIIVRDRTTNEPLQYNTMLLRAGNLYASRL